MLPWGHAAVGYLVYAVLCRYRSGQTPAEAPVIALALGTQFADLVDKPLAWYLGVIPSGRSFGHSIFTAIIVISAVDWLARRYDRKELSVAFAIGHLLHLAADAVYPILYGDWAALRFLLWPVIPQPDADTDKTIFEVLIASSFSMTGLFELVLFGVATALWLAHRAPGIWLCFRLIQSGIKRTGR